MSTPIGDKTIVSIHYKLSDDEGKLLDRSDESQPLAYLHGADNIVPGLEKELAGKVAGEKVQVKVGPEEGYGEVIEGLMMTVNKDAFQGVESVEVGMMFQSQAEDGTIKHFRVSKVDGDIVTVDGNHPLAGLTLNFDIEIVDVRKATEKEIAEGRAI